MGAGLPVALACSQPGQRSVAATLDLAASNLLATRYPRLPVDVPYIPPSVLSAVAWVESGWRQFTPQGRPLVSFDFGYGIMQVTSGMAGAFGQVNGSVDPDVQSQIASDTVYNIAYGARLLAQKWEKTPQVGDGNPATVENWYYALWAYNGWGWVNNPNNPRFSHSGNPATAPENFPYQDRVLYLVAHPPKDSDGNDLWAPVPVHLPSPKQISKNPGPLPSLGVTHPQPDLPLNAQYVPTHPRTIAPGSRVQVTVRVVNTGTQTWPATGAARMAVTYGVSSAAPAPAPTPTPTQLTTTPPPLISPFQQGSLPLPHDLRPGYSATVHTTLTFPMRVGSYLLRWDMQTGPNSWLSDNGVLPLTVHLTVSPHPAPTPTAPPPARSESMQYVADTSVPDGTAVSPRQILTKGWLVFNNGQQPWGATWRLVLSTGPSLGAKSIPVPPAAPCRSENIVTTLHAPKHPGTFTSTWRLVDALGAPVGDKLTVVLRVLPARTPVPTPTPTPAPRPQPTATATPIG